MSAWEAWRGRRQLGERRLDGGGKMSLARIREHCSRSEAVVDSLRTTRRLLERLRHNCVFGALGERWISGKRDI